MVILIVTFEMTIEKDRKKVFRKEKNMALVKGDTSLGHLSITFYLVIIVMMFL